MGDNHYDVLEVSHKASPEMVKKAYQVQMAMHHPDRGGDPERAQAVTEAYAILSDPEQRRIYDDVLAWNVARPAAPEPDEQENEDHPEPVVDWGEEVPVDEPSVEEPPSAPPPAPGTYHQYPGPSPNPFPWEPGGSAPPEPTPSGGRELPQRPLLNWVAGGALAVLSLLPLALSALTSDAAGGTLLCSGVGLAIGWVAGRSRAAGAPLGVGYVLYVLVLGMATLFGGMLLGGQMPTVTLLFPVMWVAAYVTFVETSCIWRRRVYWAQV